MRRLTRQVAERPAEDLGAARRSETPAASAASASWSCRRRSGRGSRRPRRARRRASGDRARDTGACARSRPRSPWSARRWQALHASRHFERRAAARRRSPDRRYCGGSAPSTFTPLMKKVGVDLTCELPAERDVALDQARASTAYFASKSVTCPTSRAAWRTDGGVIAGWCV